MLSSNSVQCLLDFSALSFRIQCVVLKCYALSFQFFVLSLISCDLHFKFCVDTTSNSVIARWNSLYRNSAPQILSMQTSVSAMQFLLCQKSVPTVGNFPSLIPCYALSWYFSSCQCFTVFPRSIQLTLRMWYHIRNCIYNRRKYRPAK